MIAFKVSCNGLESNILSSQPPSQLHFAKLRLIIAGTLAAVELYYRTSDLKHSRLEQAWKVGRAQTKPPLGPDLPSVTSC